MICLDAQIASSAVANARRLFHKWIGLKAFSFWQHLSEKDGREEREEAQRVEEGE